MAYRNPALPLFSVRPPKAQDEILEALQRCVRICEATALQGHEMSDSPALIWAAFKEFNFRPPSDLFGHIARRSVIEVHSSEGIQIFRNFNFYRYCSYSLEELYTMPWFRLFERQDPRFHEQLMGLVNQIFRKEISHTVPTNMPPHVVREKYSPYLHEVKLDMRFIAPLFHPGGEPAATVVVETINLLKKSRTAPDVFQLEMPLDGMSIAVAD